MSSLYERIGGAPAVNAAVALFYEKVLSDGRIKHFFAHTDMARQRDHQKMFLTMACGGVAGYSGRGMREAHAALVEKMGLNDDHFDAVLENLSAALSELHVPAALIAEVAAIAESARADVLNK